MVSRFRLPSLQDLDIIPDDTVEGKSKLRFKSVISFLRKNSVSSEKDLSRTENIRRTFQKQLKGHFVEDSEEYVSLTSFLRFIIIQYDKIDICQKITHEIEQSLLQCVNIPQHSLTVSRNPVTSILDIYKAVSQLDIVKQLGHLVVESLQDSDIPTLYLEHKICFTDQHHLENTKIFEWHFYKLDSSRTSLNLTEGIRKRLDFLHECESL